MEFVEGLANYTEYRLLELLEGRTPRPEMWWMQGFHGYGGLAPRRTGLLDEMVRHMRGEVSVNNDPYGTAPLRMRLYFSGMAIGATLDRLSADWKTRILSPDVTLTDLVESALSPEADALRKAREDARGAKVTTRNWSLRRTGSNSRAEPRSTACWQRSSMGREQASSSSTGRLRPHA